MNNDVEIAKTRLFAVTGNPILHSLSPRMHNAAFEALGIDATYTRLVAESAVDALRSAREIGITGLNVTSPFKEEMTKLCDILDKDSRQTGAVNTILVQNDNVSGFNTDVVGVKNALANNGVKLNEASALVIGAGGAAKAAVVALAGSGANVTVVNRTVEKAEQIAKRFGCEYSDVSGLNEIVPKTDILVSAISTDQKMVPQEALGDKMVVLDANYSVESALVRDAKAVGCRIIDGREWLLHQGTAAFEAFTGRMAPRKAMKLAAYANDKATGQKPNIALIGFMGSGKTTTAKGIANVNGMQNIDIDENIEQKTGTKIKDIFENHGETRFRKMEHEEITAIDGANNCVIACGGGAAINQQNVEILRKNCIVVWLSASPKTIFKRIGNDDGRPLLNVENREGVAQRIMRQRIRLYANASDIVVNTDGKTVENVAGLILNECKNRT